MPRGGKRPGSGRPKKSPSKTVRVPVDIFDIVDSLIKKWREHENKTKKIDEKDK